MIAAPLITGATLPRSARPEFTGSANEYFRIWIVNLFFTLVTLGIYSAWAKVRKKKYFYGNTRLDGDAFDYFAEPVAILKGRAIAAIAFVIYAFVSELYPTASWVLIGVGVAFLPWLIVRSAMFGARCSSWRGLRFDFTATTAETAKIILGIGALVPLTLGLAYPYFVARRKSFVASHYAFGETRFSCNVRPGALYAIYTRASLLFVALAAAAGGVAWLLVPDGMKPGSSTWAIFAFVLVFYAVIMTGYSAAYAYLQSRITNLVWSATHAPGARFESHLQARKLFGLYLGNVLAIVGSAGLLIPWAVVRVMRYRLDCFAVTLDPDTVHHAVPGLVGVGAAGQELGEIFNIDFGL
jgi:uncharacterized membrane protein YjgN (DUF898 family)